MEHNPYAVGQDIEPGSTGFPGPKFEASVRTVQIIALALIMGVVTFLGGVLVATASRIDDSPEMITKIAAGFAFLMLVNYFVIPPIIIKAQLKQAIAAGMNQKQDDEKIQKCCGIYQTQLIVGFALLEGAAFFNLVAMMLVLVFAPFTWLGWLVAFCLFRLFDIWKPFPICYFDAKLKNGFGVMFDDLLAAIYAIMCVLLLAR